MKIKTRNCSILAAFLMAIGVVSSFLLGQELTSDECLRFKDEYFIYLETADDITPNIRYVSSRHQPVYVYAQALVYDSWFIPTGVYIHRHGEREWFYKPILIESPADFELRRGVYDIVFEWGNGPWVWDIP